MDAGLHYFTFTHPDWEHTLTDRLTATAKIADQGGVSLLTVMDHYFQMEFNGGAEAPMLEAYTTLGYLAGHTSTVRLGALVTGVTYRHPGLLAKIVTSLDVLSGGRATLGIGAAWYDREHEGLGGPYPPLAERFERLEETLRICRQMWDPEDDGPFDGKHYQLAETLCVPAPVSDPHPEIMIGGGGEKKTLRLVAQYADACNLIPSSADEARHKLDVLRRHCDVVGTDYDRIRKTIAYTGESATDGHLDAFLRDIDAYTGLGLDTVILAPRLGEPAAWIESFAAPVVQRLAQLD